MSGKRRQARPEPAELLEESKPQAAAADPETVKALRREIANLTRRLEARRSGEEIILRAVEQAYQEPPDLVVPRAPKAVGKGSPEIPVLCLSDTQIGKVTATYNAAVAEQRILEAARKTIEIVERRRSFAKIDRVKLYLIGDLVEGEDIFPHQAHLIDQPVFDQAVYTAPAIFARVVILMLQHFRTVEVWSVPGNHGRNGGKGVRSHPRTNWDNVAAAVLKTMFTGTTAQKDLGGRIVWHVTTDWHIVDEELNALLVHGDQIRGGFAGMPWYGVGRKGLSWGESVKQWTGWVGEMLALSRHLPKDRPATDADVEAAVQRVFTTWTTAAGNHRHLLHGHFHQLTHWPVGRILILGNGTTESDNEYARAELGLSGDPCQRLAFFDPRKKRLVSDDPLYLR